MGYILAIDQGTTSSRAIIFDAQMQPCSEAQKEFSQHFPESGWVEHSPDDLWQSVLQTSRESIISAGISPSDLVGIGITNQRETTLVWDRATGEPLHNAIVWQDRRTSEICAALRSAGREEVVRAKTGLVIDPYFSATKIAWILDHVDGARARADAGKLAFGTVDSWLLWKMTGGKAHLTDATNACRTMLYDIHKGAWCPDLCSLFEIPMSLLPDVTDCSGHFGDTSVFGPVIPIVGMVGDQQAAAIGQGCLQEGMMKATYGTGCFALMNTGSSAVTSKHKLLTTIAYQFDGEVTYALEGSIFVAGAVVQWLRDGLGIINASRDVEKLAECSDPSQAVVLVPAFTGLGAPYWDPTCRGAIFGLTRGTTDAEIARAALQSVGYQTRDLLEAMIADFDSAAGGLLRVDGGMSASDWTLQFVADITGTAVERSGVLESSALGVALIVGHETKLFTKDNMSSQRHRLHHRFEPALKPEDMDRSYALWKRAVAAAQAF